MVLKRPALSALTAAAALFAMGCGDPAEDAARPGNSVPVVLFAPIQSTSTYLITLDGQKLHEWTSAFPPGYSAHLLPNGMLMRAASLPNRPLLAELGGNGGRVEMLDWDSNVAWSYDYVTRDGQQHHDAIWMPHNGHVLMVAWEQRSKAEALAAGRAPSRLPQRGGVWVDKLVEVDPASNEIVWEWRIWDHLVPPGASPADHPGLIDPNFAATPDLDWTHANSVAYDETRDQVILSVRNFHEVWIIDHGTTTEEAAGHRGGRLGHGGDLVYRWGNSRAYDVHTPPQLWGQHNAHWIAPGLPGAGHLLVFDNGDARRRPYSRVVEWEAPLLADGSYSYDPTVGFGPAAPYWHYVASPPEQFFAPIISGAHRLASGNTFVTDGPVGRFFEVTPSGETVWSYVVTDTLEATGHFVFRAVRYEPGYAGLADRILTPQGLLRIPAVASPASMTRY